MPDSPKDNAKPNLNETQQRELLAENECLKAQLATKEAAEREAREQKIGFTKWLLGRWIGESVRKHAHQIRKELPTPSQKAITDLIASIFIRLTQIGPFAILLAILPISLLLVQTCTLMQQNHKIDAQNDLVQAQNEKIDKQVYLEEASRRNSLVFLMDNILNQVNIELNKETNTDSLLSSPLIGRIQALAQGFQPYKFLEGNTLTRPLSPERGQFLLALASSGIGKATLRKIYKKAPFQYAYLKGAKMGSLYLESADLRDADLKYAVLRYADLSGTDLRNADLYYAVLRNAVLRNAVLYYADLRNAVLSNTDLRNAILRYADLRNADLSYADLRNADLSYADLRKAKVYQENWLELLTEWEVFGREDIRNKYKLIPSKDRWKNDCFELQLKDTIPSN